MLTDVHNSFCLIANLHCPTRRISTVKLSRVRRYEFAIKFDQEQPKFATKSRSSWRPVGPCNVNRQASLFRRFTKTNVYETGSVKLRKTRHKKIRGYADIFTVFCSVLFFNHPRYEVWLHHGRPFSSARGSPLLSRLPPKSSQSMLWYCVTVWLDEIGDVRQSDRRPMMKLCVSLLIVGLLLMRAHVAVTTSNVFCSHEFAAAVVRACVRIRTARTPYAKAAPPVLGNT